VVGWYRCHVHSGSHHDTLAAQTNAYPADELMPLSCKGRVRGVDESRGDIDDALGNFSLTLVDTLDALAVMGLTHEFLRAVQLVIADVKVCSGCGWVGGWVGVYFEVHGHSARQQLGIAT
jgi:hypothetical protein